MATAPNPLMLALMQRLAGQAQGGAPGGPPGGPPGPGGPGGPLPGGGGLEAARGIAQTPFGQETQDLKQMQTQVGAMVPRFLQRDASIATDLVTIYKTLDKISDKIAKLPAAPVMAPPPGMPMMGGASMMPPPEASPFG